MATVYKEIYSVGKKIPKADKLGLHATLQDKVLLAFENTVSAAFAELIIKKKHLEQARTALEVAKHLLRTEQQLRIVTEKTYIRLAGLLIEASKMNAAWLKNTEERIAKTNENQTKNSLF